MSRFKKILVGLLTLLLIAIGLLLTVGWPASNHPTRPALLGTARQQADLEAVLLKPGPITVETVVGADWEVDRSGLINLNHAKAKAAGLSDGPEPVQVLFHALRHPERGLYIIDSGVERALRDDPEHAVIRGMVARAMHIEKMAVVHDTAGWLASQQQPLAGVLLTHLHLDHTSGMRDVPRGTPIYAGPGETRDRAALNVFVQPIVDGALEGHDAIQEWAYQPNAGDTFAGAIDVFGDASLWALWVPGHTSGSTAYLARTPEGPVLFVGDACHTAWGWENGVEPGTFSHDGPTSAQSLAKLQALVAKYPQIQVKLGHQRLAGERATATATAAPPR